MLANYIDAIEDWQTIGQAANGQEALTLTNQLHPDIILMDIVMPELDGAKAAEIIKTSMAPADHPFIILFSAYSTPEIINKALAKGADAFLPKHELDYEHLSSLINRKFLAHPSPET